MSKRFSVTTNLAVTTPIVVDYSKEDFFLKGIFEPKQVIKSASASKNNIKLKEWYIFLSRTSQTCSQIKRRFTCIGHTNCSLATVKLTLFLTNN